MARKGNKAEFSIDALLIDMSGAIGHLRLTSFFFYSTKPREVANNGTT